MLETHIWIENVVILLNGLNSRILSLAEQFGWVTPDEKYSHVANLPVCAVAQRRNTSNVT